MVSVCVSFNLKGANKDSFPRETVGAGENCFTPELNEREVVELNTREHRESLKVWHENI